MIFNSNSLAPPNYTLGIGNPTLTSTVNAPAVFNGTLFATACYISPVLLSCGSGAPPKCTASPNVVTPTIAGAPFTVTVSSNQANTYSFGIAGQGTDPLQIQHVALVSFSTGADASGFIFQISNVSGPESVTAGATAVFTLQLSPTTDSFPSAVSLSYSECPPISTCSLSQAQVPAGKGATTLTFTVQTSAVVVAAQQEKLRRAMLIYALGFFWPGLMFAGSVSRRRKIFLALLGLGAVLLVMLSCGGGLQGGSTAAADPGTPIGVYGMTVNAVMNSAPGAPSSTTSLTLTVTPD